MKVLPVTVSLPPLLIAWLSSEKVESVTVRLPVFSTAAPVTFEKLSPEMATVYCGVDDEGVVSAQCQGAGPGPSIVSFWVISMYPLVNVITLQAGDMSKSMVSPALASAIVWRSEPAPESLQLVTVSVLAPAT